MQQSALDVLIVGGGVVGAGAAVDASSRGLSTAIVEQHDWASGTSSRSSKLVHGGIRYLEQLDFNLVREALKERGLLLQHLAPHLVKPVPFLFPLRNRFTEPFYVGSGMTLYDLLAGSGSGLPRHRYLSASRLRAEMPGLAPGRFTGGLSYYDAQVDDARLVATLARTAASLGAMALNRVKAIGFSRSDPSGDGMATVTLRDEESGDTALVRARHVIGSTGVWTSDFESLIGSPVGLSVTMSKGVHFLVRRERIELGSGIIDRTEKSVLFIIPWGQHWIVGTTDTPWKFDKENPAPTRGDIDYLIAHANRVLADPVSREDIVGVYAGLRPLVAGTASSTTKLSREHVVGVPFPGVAAIAGGKLTTYRVMAQDVVDAVLGSTGTIAGPSQTDHLPLLGAQGSDSAEQRCRRALAARGITTSPARRLASRYGGLGADVVALADTDRKLASLLPGTEDVLCAEISYAVQAEDARHLDDVLVRRTRLAIELEDAGVGIAPAVADIMSQALGWTEDQCAAEVARYTAAAHRDRQARALPDEESAEAVLLPEADKAAHPDRAAAVPLGTPATVAAHAGRGEAG